MNTKEGLVRKAPEGLGPEEMEEINRYTLSLIHI